MDSALTFANLAAVLKAYGPFGILVVIWYFDARYMRTQRDQDRKDRETDRKETANILAQHAEYMAEIRRMYERNVRLVERYDEAARSFQDVVVMNTRALTKLCDEVRTNQYCPAARVEKRKVEVAG